MFLHFRDVGNADLSNNIGTIGRVNDNHSHLEYFITYIY